MESVSHSLRELGVPPARIHVEKFRSLDLNPFDAPIARADDRRCARRSHSRSNSTA